MNHQTQNGRTSQAWRALFAFCLIGIFLVGFASKSALAQMDQGAITGVVTDPSGAAIPDADLTLMNVDTGLVLKTKANASGNYFFAPIKTGTYKVSATAPNFETTVQENVIVHVTDRLNIPLTLKPGKVSETVTVTSAAPLMQSQTAEMAIDIDSKFLNDAPLANRNWVFIAQEAPGSTPMVGRGAGNGDFSSNGQHEEQNNFMLDGVDNNTVNSDYINGSTYHLAPPPDAIAEFKLETSNYSAEIGRGHAAVLNATTKSGTNNFHGDAYEYVRNTIFNALNWNQKPGTAAPFHLNQFGASVGGPIIKNHLFYFGDLQESRFAIGATPSTYTVPTPRMRQGDFSELLNTTYTNGTCPVVLFTPNANTGSYSCAGNKVGGTGPSGKLQQFAGTSSPQVTSGGFTFAQGQNVFSQAQLDTVAQKILKMYPCPNYSQSGPNAGQVHGGWKTGDCNAESDLTSAEYGQTVNNYQVNLLQWTDPIQWDQRLDWNVSSRDLATFRFDYQHFINTLLAPLGPVLDGYGNYAGHNQSYLTENAMLSETHTFSPTLINEFRFGYNWGNDANLQYNYNTNMADALGMHGMPFSQGPQNGGLPPVNIGGMTGFGSHENDPAHEGENVWEVLDNVTKIVGNHALKTGLEWMPIRFYSTAAGRTRGEYYYNGTIFTSVTGVGNSGSGIADFLSQGYDASGNLTGTDNMGSASMSTFGWNHYLHQYVAGYIQDDWKVTHNLTLNIGMRYEYFTPKLEQADEWANYVQGDEAMTANGAVASGVMLLPASQAAHALPANLATLLAADNIKVVYDSNRHLVSYPKANWSPRLGAAYQINNKTVARIGGGLFFGAFEPGGGAALTQNPPYVTTATTSLASCSSGAYCASLYTQGDTLENGLPQYLQNGGVANNAGFPGIQQVDPQMRTPRTANYNLSVQRAITPTTTVTVAFVGSLGRHLVTLKNNPDMPLAITIGGQQQNGMTPAPHFSGSQWMTWVGDSSYNSLQVSGQKQYSNGLSFYSSYTWAHALDNTNDLLGGDIGGYKQSQLIPVQYEWSQSGYDLRHRLVANVDYELPFGVGKRFVNHPGILDYIVGGWKSDMQWWGQTGQPFTVSISRIGGYGNANGGLSNSAVKVGDPFSTTLTPPNPTDGSNPNPLIESGVTSAAASNTAANVCAAQTKTKSRWYNPCAFADPIGVSNSNNAAAAALLQPYATGNFSYYSPAIATDTALNNGKYNSNGTTNTTFVTASNPGGGVPYLTGYTNVRPFFGSPKNDVSGPGNWKLNASFFKDFKTFREQYLEFRADAFNILNHPSWGGVGNVGTNIGAGAQVTGPMAVQTNTLDARYFQLSGKYVF